MPVPTNTFRSIGKLNLIFAASSLLMLVATCWMVIADHDRPWRHYPIASRNWQTAMTVEAKDRALSLEYKKQLAAVDAELNAILDVSPAAMIADKERGITELEGKIQREQLPLIVAKGKVNPKSQELERAVNQFGRQSDQVRKLQDEFDQIVDVYSVKAQSIERLESKLKQLGEELTALLAQQAQAEKRKADLERKQTDFEAKLADLNPKGVAWVGEMVRDAPLLDWLNSSLRVEQAVVPGIHTDYNFMTVETIDRCKTCHVNIDDPKFERLAQISFVERQVAMDEGQDVNTIDQPVVMLEFWEHAASKLEEVPGRYEQINSQAIGSVNELIGETEREDEIKSVDQLLLEMARIAASEKGSVQVSRRRWYKNLEYYRSDLQAMLEDHLGRAEYRKLLELYRHRLIARYNQARSGDPLSADAVLLAHPDLERYAEAESTHPMKTMGCTVCHEGSGQETQFVHTVHTPSEAWVDLKTGGLVPDFLIRQEGDLKEIKRNIRLASDGLPIGELALVSSTSRVVDEHAHDGTGDYHLTTHHDLNINNPTDPAPFAPVHEPSAKAGAAYSVPRGMADEELAVAIRQANYWTKHYGWHHVHYMHWEKPMHALEHIESSCSRCHTEIFDIQDEAPRLFRGRTLFSNLGCVNCHAVEALEDDLDIKRVGPSLVNVRHKLSEQMLATWVWSPKAFRPTTRMPHYFMLENNSAPADIKRTRVEVAAIARYLSTAQPSAAYYEENKQPIPDYAPEVLLEEAGDVTRGREIFLNVGCMSCHTNLDEFGEQWITQDLMDRAGVGDDEAYESYESMTYNQRHWYVLEHLSERLERTGPELSGVGSKLLAGRTEVEARGWLYDWLRNPRHYSSYTIMPSFRLSSDEANDLASYLLTLQRPGIDDDSVYVPGNFSMDANGQRIARELLAVIKAGTSTLELSRSQVAQAHPDSGVGDTALFTELGRNLIRHYGCAGCHLINGLEAEASACTNLDDWGLKDPHKIAFEYFDHTFDKVRKKPINVWKVKHEGLGDGAIHIDGGVDVSRIEISWEHMDLERRPWLYHKLHNTRLFDRSRSALDSQVSDADNFDASQGDSIGRPYDKLKMPKFFLSDDQVRDLVTFVTSIRKPLVSENMQQVTDEVGQRVIRGRQLATRFNCYGCHNIELNDVNIHQYFNIYFKDGTYDENALNWAPPRLVGQGAKTQPHWLHHFLQNVESIRPWLKVRMPSFSLTAVEASTLVDYLSGDAQVLAGTLASLLVPIDEYLGQYAIDYPVRDWTESKWYSSPGLTTPVNALKKFAVGADIAYVSDLDPRQTDEMDLDANWAKLLKDVRALAGTYEIHYPYVDQLKPDPSDEEFLRGEKLFVQMGCMLGQCHRMGDEELLIQEGIFTPHVPFPHDTAAGTEEESDESDEDGEFDEPTGDGDEEYEDDEYYDEEDEGGFTLTPSTPAEGAPNLGRIAERLQPGWVINLLQYARRIQPGTRMQEFWTDGKSHFALGGLPEDTRRKWESLFGADAAGQRDLLMNFLYTAGPRGLTYNVDGKQIGPGPGLDIELTPLEPLPQVNDASGVDKTNEVSSEEPRTLEITVESQGQSAPPEKMNPIPKAALQPVASTIELHDEPVMAYEGTRIVGVVKFEGRARKPKKIDMSADKNCGLMHAVSPRKQELLVNKDKSIRNVLVYVKSGLKDHKVSPSSEAVEMDQLGCAYVPHVTVATVGQPVKILNSDHTDHNVKALLGRKTLFNRASSQGSVLEQIFNKPQLITIKCDVHSWMSGYLHVLEHEFFSVSDIEGRFEIKGLPPGTYELETWHEMRRIKPITVQVTVEAGTSHRIDIDVR